MYYSALTNFTSLCQVSTYASSRLAVVVSSLCCQPQTQKAMVSISIPVEETERSLQCLGIVLKSLRVWNQIRNIKLQVYSTNILGKDDSLVCNSLLITGNFGSKEQLTD